MKNRQPNAKSDNPSEPKYAAEREADGSEDDDDDELPVVAATAVADTCSASHEFEWLSPNSQSAPFPKPGVFQELPPAPDEAVTSSCQIRSYRRHRKAQCCPADGDCGMSPTSFADGHACCRHASPVRSTWCCSSPPPHAACLHHHGASNLELNRDCCGPEWHFWPYPTCSCLPPRYHDSYGWCRNSSPHHDLLRRETSSPCHQNVHRRSRSTSHRMRDGSPSPLSPRCSPVPTGDATQYLCRQVNYENRQATIHSEDVTNFPKIRQLESDKKNLLLQASVLAEQVEVQSDKISELEKLLEKKNSQLCNVEENLHQEMQTRSTVENSKLELVTELSNLRLRLTAAEQDRKDCDNRCKKLENELVLLHARLKEKELEYFALKNNMLRNGIIIPSNDKNSDLEKLQFALDSVMVSNDEKDRKIDDLHLSLNKYKKLQEFLLSSNTRKESDSSIKDVQLEGDCCSDYVTSSSLGNEILTNSHDDDTKPLKFHLQNPKSSTPNQGDASVLSWKESAVSRCSPISIRSSPATYSTVPVFYKSNSLENICSTTSTSYSKDSPHKTQFSTMPRHTGLQTFQHLQDKVQRLECDNQTLPKCGSSSDGFQRSPLLGNLITSRKNNASSSDHSQHNHHKSSGVSFGKGFFKLKSGKRSSSAPELAPQEAIAISLFEKENNTCNLQPFTQQYFIKPEKDKSKRFLKFFSKWKRTGSQNITKMEFDFKRGGIRATAGPRLGWSQDPAKETKISFDSWDTELVVDWLHKMGLGMYSNDCQRWMCNGEKLLKASSQDLEKELNVKNPLHKKKLLLAIKWMNSSLKDLPESVNQMDHQWVIRWLDDIGLPQYKDSFGDARVDGRVLHYLTVEDLLFLKVVSQLHHISIKCGIQVLRENNFDPHCLVRRSCPDENKSYSPELVALWTNHRVMEWLRTVDLSEYAPNLRGSGVHGALIVYEAKFNTDLFATLLNIPPTKTLLRRHLATHFKHIVGSDLVQLKRGKETEQAYTPLSPSFKIKTIKKNQFILKKKRNKTDANDEEYVCPMDIPVRLEVAKPYEGDKLIVRRNSDPSPQEPRLLGIQTMFRETNLLPDAPTTIV